MADRVRDTRAMNVSAMSFGSLSAQAVLAGEGSPMTLIPHANDKSVPAPAELRKHVTRATGRLRETAVQVGRLVEDKTPDPVLAGALRTATRVRETAARAGRFAGHRRVDSVRAGAGRAATLARANRTALTAAVGVLTAAVLAGRARRARRTR